MSTVFLVIAALLVSQCLAWKDGDTVCVSAGGLGLNVRDSPGTDKNIIGTLADGVSLKTTGKTSTASSLSWLQVSGSFGSGWAAEKYLVSCTGTGGSGNILSATDVCKLLKSNGFPASDIPKLVCAALKESAFNTRALNTKNSNGSWDWGLFQLNDRYWCGRSEIGGDCRARCTDLYDAAKNVACAKVVYTRHGMSAWYGYTGNKAYCDSYTISC